jgi:hypothetical protein
VNVELSGRLEAFGFAPSTVAIQAIARSTSWRMTRGLLALGIGLGVAPVVFFVPPHIPWVIAALATGGVIGQRRFTERYTLRKLDAKCPCCDAAVGLEPGRLTEERMVQCPSCSQSLMLHVDMS